MRCPSCNREIPDESKFCSYCGVDISKAFEEKLEEGIRLLEELKYQKALEIFDNLAKNEFKKAWFYRGKALKEIGIQEDDEAKIKEALRSLEEYLKFEENPEALYEKALILGLLEKHKEALSVLEIALKYDPNNPKYKKYYEITKEVIAEKKKEEAKIVKEAKPRKIKGEKLSFPEAYSVLLIGKPGVGKLDFLVSLAKDYLSKGEKIAFITTERSPKEIKGIFRKYGLEIDEYEGKSFIFIDLYSYSAQEKYEKALTIDNPANLNLITLNLEKAKTKIGILNRVFFDSLSTLFLHVKDAEITKFFGVLNSRIKTSKATLFTTLQEGMHEEKTVIALKHLVDANLEMTKGKISVVFARHIELPNEFYFDVAKGIISFEKPVVKPLEEVKKEKVEFKAKPLLIGTLAVLALLAFFFVFHHPSTEKKVETSTKQGQEIKIEKQNILSMRDGELVLYNMKDAKAPNKGWLVADAKYYKISINLDKSYYLLYDKLNDLDLIIYNDTVKSITDMLTGSDMGFADYDGTNKLPFTSTAIHDKDGITYSIITSNENEGFVLISTQGWDVTPLEMTQGYDAEGQIFFGIFSNKPYYIEAVQVYNLQDLGYMKKIDYRNPDAIVKTWVINGEYDSLSIFGGDYNHMNKHLWLDYYKVQTLSPIRKPFHAGSASISLMFPDHILIGNKLDGAVIFSLPKGYFRFDTDKGAKGAQVALEFVINVDKPVKAVAFTAEPVSREAFLYDIKEFSTVQGYNESMQEICKRYGLSCPPNPLDAHDWEYKRFAYVITLVKDWYNPELNEVKEDAWKIAEQGVSDFYKYETLIYNQMVSSKPLVAKVMTG